MGCLQKIVLLTVCRYRFPDMFPDAEHVRDMQRELDEIIQLGVASITRLVRAAEARSPGAAIIDSEDDFEIEHRKQKSDAFTSEMDNDGEDDIPVQKPSGLCHSDSFSSDSARDSRLSSSFLQAKNAMKQGQPGIKEVKVGQGRLASQLVREGIISPEVLAKLQAEWQLARDASSGSRAASEHRNDSLSNSNRGNSNGAPHRPNRGNSSGTPHRPNRRGRR